MTYVIFVVQLIFAGIKVLKISSIESVYNIPLVGLSILICFLLFYFRVTPFLITLFSFILNPFLLSFTPLMNFLPYISLYFALLGMLKERGIRERKIRTFLLPVIMPGFLIFSIPGVFERPLRIYLSYLFFTPGKETDLLPGSEKPTNFLFPDGTGDLFNRSVDLFINNQNFIFILANILFIFYIIMIVFFLFFQDFEESSIQLKRRRFSRQVLTFAIIILSFILILMAYRIVPLLLSNARGSASTFNEFYQLIPFLIIIVLSAFAVYLWQRKSRGSVEQPSLPHNLFAVSLGMILFSLALFLIPINKKGLSENLINNLGILSFIVFAISMIILSISTIISFWASKRFGGLEVFGDRNKEFLLHFYKKDVIETLDKTEDPQEFVLFAYFVITYMIVKKGIEIEQHETPNEILTRLGKLLDIPYFEEITYFFNLVRYGNKKIDAQSFGTLKQKVYEAIFYLRNLELKDLKLKVT